MINKMNIKKLFPIAIFYLLNFGLGESFIAVKCDEKYNISKSSCQKYDENFANNLGENLPKTLVQDTLICFFNFVSPANNSKSCPPNN